MDTVFLHRIFVILCGFNNHCLSVNFVTLFIRQDILCIHMDIFKQFSRTCDHRQATDSFLTSNPMKTTSLKQNWLQTTFATLPHPNQTLRSLEEKKTLANVEGCIEIHLISRKLANHYSLEFRFNNDVFLHEVITSLSYI